MTQHINDKKYFILLLMIIILSACRMGKEYQRPSVLLPDKFSTGNQVSYADTSSIADIEWKNFFTDPTLLDLIDKGIKNNNDLLTSIKRIDIAQRQVNQS